MGKDKQRQPSGLRIVQGASAVIQALMNSQGVTKAELARRVGKSRAYVTQSLSGDRNMTLSTFAGFADALDADAVLDARPRESSYGKLVPKRPAKLTPTAQKGADDEQRRQRQAEDERSSSRKRR
ncbi:MAG: helix-turn-helix transcriptional regulator [bacterium]